MESNIIYRDDPKEIFNLKILDVNGGCTKESFKAAIKPPYAIKYLLNIIILASMITLIILWNTGIIPSNKIGFFCNDPLFSFKFTGDTVDPIVLGVGIAFIPPLVYFIVEAIRQGSICKCFRLPVLMTFYLYAKHYTYGFILVGMTTELAKTIVGEHRPHFFDTCKPDTNINCTSGTYIETFTCTSSDTSFPFNSIVDASRSFPSGHSSMSWYAIMYCLYVIQTRLPVYRLGTQFKLLLMLLCVLFALLASLTRITDRRHHWWDVLIGTVLGIWVAACTILINEKHIRQIIKDVRESQNNLDKIKCEA